MVVLFLTALAAGRPGASNRVTKDMAKGQINRGLVRLRNLTCWMRQVELPPDVDIKPSGSRSLN